MTEINQDVAIDIMTKLVLTGPVDNNAVDNNAVDNNAVDNNAVDNNNNSNDKSETLETFDYNSIAINMVQFQVEYHLSDDNLALDNFLLSKMHQDPQYWISIKIIACLPKIKEITEDIEIILSAIRKSNILILNKDETKIKRKDYIPPKPKHHKNMRRTVFIYGLSQTYDKQKIIQLCAKYGKLRAIVFDNGLKYILDDQHVKNNDLEEIDRNVAIQIMTKKFGPRAVRSNSTAFSDILSPSQKRDSNDSINSSLDNPIFVHPIFVHPIPNPNGNPLDFSHLKTCFVIFESQSQANNFIKSRAKINNTLGIGTLHQYEYIKYQKRTSMNNARGISPLISPSSIQFALNSPTYSILGSTKNKKKYRQQSPSQEAINIQQQQQQATNAMEYYLADFNTTTPIMIVPANIAQVMAQTLHNKLNTAPHSHYSRYSHESYKNKRNNNNYNHGKHNSRFDFDINHNHKKYRNNNNNNRYYRGSQSVKHRNMRRSWRNSGNNHSQSGYFPPSPSPNYFKSARNRNSAIKVESSAPKYVVKHKSPAITPCVSTIFVPNDQQQRATL